MLYEIPIVAGAITMSAAILIPEYQTLLENPTFTPGPSIAVAAGIASFGIYLGIILALSNTSLKSRIIELLFWCLAAAGISWMAGSCALAAQNTGSRAFYLAVASVPLIIYLWLPVSWLHAFIKQKHAHHSKNE